MRVWPLLAVAACSAPIPVPTLSAQEAFDKRQACTFAAGALPQDTLSSDTPMGDAIPAEHIVMIMQENRPFDHYYSKLGVTGLEVASPTATNPDSTGAPVARYHETRYCVPDPDNSWEGSHRQWDNGKNDGFVIDNGDLDGGGARAMGYYDETDLPYYYALSKTFAISDAHFASVMGPTLPNRITYFSGSPFGEIENEVPPLADAQGRPYPNLFTRLNDAHVSWGAYSTNIATPAVFLSLLESNLDNFKKVDDFFNDVANDTMPQVSVVEAGYGEGVGGDETDEHASANIQLGQQFVASIVNAVMASKAWPKTIIFISYDEHGGFYDSVPPPKACVPDDIPPTGDTTYTYDHYGFRVPLIIVSPYAKRGYLSHVVSDHTSILRFLAAKYGMKALTARDANADALMDLFDFANPDVSVPALPDAGVDQARLAQCHIDFPDAGM